eukprot:Gb_09183 [translate_table: standard]
MGALERGSILLGIVLDVLILGLHAPHLVIQLTIGVITVQQMPDMIVNRRHVFGEWLTPFGISHQTFEEGNLVLGRPKLSRLLGRFLW